jgi:hypothetical protein
MNETRDNYRVFLAVTERSALPELWKAVEEQLEDACAELVTLFVNDARWRRAASLSFTEEVSRVNGTRRDFTPQRAAQVDEHISGWIQRQVRELAEGTELKITFEVLKEHEAGWLRNVASMEEDVFIVPASLKAGPLNTELSRLTCRILYVDTGEE